MTAPSPNFDFPILDLTLLDLGLGFDFKLGTLNSGLSIVLIDCESSLFFHKICPEISNGLVVELIIKR